MFLQKEAHIEELHVLGNGTVFKNFAIQNRKCFRRDLYSNVVCLDRFERFEKCYYILCVLGVDGVGSSYF